MTSRLPLPGELWTVPEAGPHALVLVLSNPAENSTGALDFQGIGARVFVGDRSNIHMDEVVIGAAETDGGTPIAVELWNLRPLLVRQLGEPVGRVTSASAFDAVWDAFVRMADPQLVVDLERFGLLVPGPEMISRRHGELVRWHALSMQTCARTTRVQYDSENAGTYSVADQVKLITYLIFDGAHAVQVNKRNKVKVWAVDPMIAPPRLVGVLLPPTKAKKSLAGKAVKKMFKPPLEQTVDLDFARERLAANYRIASDPVVLKNLQMAVCR